MRIKFNGSVRLPEPIIITLANGIPFRPQVYLAQGYTRYDVLCIGAAGGYGGTAGTVSTGYNNLLVHGGGPGGGGSHLVRNRDLSLLPSSVPIVVGSQGARGNDATKPPTLASTATNGADGGYSSFNDTVCRASGGQGGLAAVFSGSRLTAYAFGGAGGLGNRTTAGGGGSAGTGADLNGGNGSWDGSIGGGGGGGVGGIGLWSSETLYISPGVGGAGAWNATDQTMFSSPGGSINLNRAPILTQTAPDGGGGAQTYKLNGLTSIFGSGAPASQVVSGDGIVMIRLYA